MNEYEIKHIHDIVKDSFWIMPQTPTFINSGIPYITSKNIKNETISFKNISYISESDYRAISNSRPIEIGDVLISMIGTLGEIAEVKKEHGEFYGQNMFLLRLNNEIIDKRFFFNYFKSDIAKICINQSHNKSTQKYLKANHILEMNIPLPPLETQKQIAANLDKVTHTIDLCNAILEKLDMLVKARFVEMFGDPVTNPHKWEKVNISTVVGGKVSNGFFAKRDEYCDNGNVKVLGVANIVNRMYSNIEELPQTNGSNADIEKYGVKYGDMLFCRSSLVATGIGKASIVPKEVPSNVLFECHVIRLPLNLTKCVPEFMQVLSTTDYFRNQVISQSKTATMTTIGQDGILKSEIILPPLELQKQFLMFVEQTDKSKSAVKQVLEKAETLKKALMQEYFG